MMPLSEAEAAVIDYLYKHGQKPRYPAEVSKETSIPRRSVYTALDALEKKGVVEKEQIGRMKLYKLKEKWEKVAEAAKLPNAETDEAPSPDAMAEKVRQIERFLPFAERAFDTPTVTKLSEALDAMKKELKKRKAEKSK